MKKRQIVLIVMGAVVLFYLLWFITFSLIIGITYNGRKRAFSEGARAYLSTNEEFISQYGHLISANTDDRKPKENKNSELDEYYMDFVCVTDRGQYFIRVVHVWNDGWWTYRFEYIGAN